jgi:hypothetical protein
MPNPVVACPVCDKEGTINCIVMTRYYVSHGRDYSGRHYLTYMSNGQIRPQYADKTDKIKVVINTYNRSKGIKKGDIPLIIGTKKVLKKFKKEKKWEIGD